MEDLASHGSTTFGVIGGFNESERRRRRIDEETEQDRCIRKYTMSNILLFIFAIIIYKLFILIGFGYHTFQHHNHEDCYADLESKRPVSTPIDDSNINISFQYSLVFQIGFWISFLQAFLFFPSIKSKMAQKLLCIMIFPDMVLFVCLNVIMFSPESKICSGLYLTE